MTGLNDAMWIVGSYVVLFAFIYIVLNFLTKGFIGQYLKVKASRGKYTLVKCNDVTDTYYKSGKIDNKRNLTLKDRYRKVHTFSGLDMTFVRRELGTNLIEVDLVKGCVLNRDFSAIKGYDTTITDEMVNRALMLPKIGNDEMKEKIIFLLAIGTFIGVAVIIYILFTQEPATCTAVVETVAGGVNI